MNNFNVAPPNANMAGSHTTNIYGDSIYFRYKRTQDTQSGCDVSVLDISTGSSCKIYYACLAAVLAIGIFKFHEFVLVRK